MRCNIPKTRQPSKKFNKLALTKNTPKVAKVLELGKKLDDLEDLYKRTEDPEKKAEIKAKMDETHDKIVTMSAEINEECLVKKKKDRSEDSATEDSEEDTEISKEG